MSIATPSQLMQDPELAALEILDSTIQQVIYALFAAHPQLVSGGSLEHEPSVPAEAWLADAIYNQGIALQHAIDRYREALARRHLIEGASCSGDF